jgi:hypothetical protein
MGKSRLLTKGFNADFSSKKSKSEIFAYSEIKDLLEDYKVSAGNIMEACKDAYWEAGEFIVQQASDMCPVDTETMESAIFVVDLGNARSAYQEKFTLHIGYDPGIAYPSPRYKDGRTTGSVFEYIHELITPEGDKQLGKKSEAKQGRVDVIVGGGFMRRAIEDNENEIREIIKASVQRSLSEMGVTKKKYRYKPKRGKMYRVGVDGDF